MHSATRYVDNEVYFVGFLRRVNIYLLNSLEIAADNCEAHNISAFERGILKKSAIVEANLRNLNGANEEQQTEGGGN